MVSKDNLTFEKWDISEDLKNENDIKRFLNEALKENDTRTLELALKEIAKARLRMTKENNTVSISRATIYRQLAGNGKLSVDNFFKILKKLDLHLEII